MRAKLSCHTGTFNGFEHTFDNLASIGRARDNEVSLDDSSVSNYHARIRYDVDIERFVLVDMKSRNKTRLDGQRVTQPESLDDLHIITIAGKHEFIFQDISKATSTKSASPSKRQPIPKTEPKSKPKSKHKSEPIPETRKIPTISPKSVAPPEQTVVDDLIVAPPSIGASQPDISKTVVEEQVMIPPQLDTPNSHDQDQTVINEDVILPPPTIPPITPPPPSRVCKFSIGSTPYELKSGEYTIGRIEGNHIVVNESSISRKHAILKITQDKVTIEDSGSKNGVIVNEVQITSKTLITANCKILIGDVPLSLTE